MTMDPRAATSACIDGLGTGTLAKAAACTTGNHWLLLWGLLVTACVTPVVVWWGVLDRLEARLGRLFPRLARVFGSRASLPEPAGLPDVLATALVKTAEYRNPRPSLLEERAFYDHPSVERRVLRAMEWKASHVAT